MHKTRLNQINVVASCNENIVKAEQAKIKRFKTWLGKSGEICQTAPQVVPFLVGELGIISRNLSALQDVLVILDIIRSA